MSEAKVNPKNPKNVEYKTVSRAYSKDLDCEVNKMINNGWMPIGGAVFCMSATGNSSRYVQTMIKADTP